MSDLATALRQASAVGPYFAVTSTADPVEPWLPFTALTRDQETLHARVGRVRDTMSARAGGQVELRVAASIDLLGLAARVLGPALATATLAGLVPCWTPDRLRWQQVAGGPVPLAAVGSAAEAVTGVAEAAAALVEHVVRPVVTPLAQAYAGLSVSPVVLRGNLASALSGAATMLRGTPCRLDAHAVAAAALGHEPLVGAGRFEQGRFRRASCCLYYRVPGGGYCGDCVLAR